MTQLFLCCPTYKRFDLWENMVHSAMRGTRLPDRIIVLENTETPQIEATVERLTSMYDVQIDYIQGGRNHGVGRGWNILMKHAESIDSTAYVMIVNDDTELLPDTIEKFVEAIDNEHTQVIYCTDGPNVVSAFSMYVTNPRKLRETVGWFDETIWPAYYEDNDMYYRMKLQGLDLYRVPNCGAVHKEGGSATLKNYTGEERQRHDMQFMRNQSYYTVKWGGLPHEEKHRVPFNNADIMNIMQQLYKYFGF